MNPVKLLIALLLLISFAGLSLAGQWTVYTKDNTELSSNEVLAVCVDGNGIKWFGTKNGLTSFDGATWKTYTADDNLAHNEVSSIVFEVTNYGPEIWVGTEGGVSVIGVAPDAVTFATPYSTENTGLISNSVSAAAVDTAHVKWFGTDKGVSSFDGYNWAGYTTDNLLSENRVLSIAAAFNGWVYFGTDGGGVSRFDGVSSASPYDTDWSGIASNKVTAAFVTPDGIKWFGTDKGISSHTGDDTKTNWTTYTTDDGLAGNLVYSITGDSKGRLWAGTNGGVSKFDGVSWKSYTTGDGLAGNNVYAVAVDLNGTLWFGTDAGVTEYIPDDVSVEKDKTLPAEFAILGCFPNPFNPETTIEYNLPGEVFVELSVYSVSGQKVRQLVHNKKSAGKHTAVWDGCDENGMRVSSGIYISHLKMGNTITSGRMVMVK